MAKGKQKQKTKQNNQPPVEPSPQSSSADSDVGQSRSGHHSQRAGVRFSVKVSFGTFRKCRDVRLESEMRTKADVRRPPEFMGSRPSPGRPPDRKRDLWTHRSNSGVGPVTDRKVVVFGDRTAPDLRRAHTTTRLHLLGLQRCPCRLLRARSGYDDQISQRLNA
jgi:hypothetical protein